MIKPFFLFSFYIIYIAVLGQESNFINKIEAKYTFEENINDISINKVKIKPSFTPIIYSNGILGNAIELNDKAQLQTCYDRLSSYRIIF